MIYRSGPEKLIVIAHKSYLCPSINHQLIRKTFPILQAMNIYESITIQRACRMPLPKVPTRARLQYSATIKDTNVRSAVSVKDSCAGRKGESRYISAVYITLGVDQTSELKPERLFSFSQWLQSLGKVLVDVFRWANPMERWECLLVIIFVKAAVITLFLVLRVGPKMLHYIPIYSPICRLAEGATGKQKRVRCLGRARLTCSAWIIKARKPLPLEPSTARWGLVVFAIVCWEILWASSIGSSG